VLEKKHKEYGTDSGNNWDGVRKKEGILSTTEE
jgi:hypothetical protein